MALLCAVLLGSAHGVAPPHRGGGAAAGRRLEEDSSSSSSSVVVEGDEPPYHRSTFMQHRHRNVHHRLRICNAYPNRLPLDVFEGHRRKLTENEPLAYKACRDFLVVLKVGAQLDFSLGGHSAGIFVVQSLPSDRSVLLLVVRRTHDADSNAVAFTSHLFAPHEGVQVAVVDAYTGTERALASVGHVWPQKQGETASKQLLKYNSMVTLGEGMYDVNISRTDGHAMQRSQLVALNHESYVILRTGLEADEGDSFPDELVVYPLSDASHLPKPSGAQAKPWFLSAVIAAMVFAMSL